MEYFKYFCLAILISLASCDFLNYRQEGFVSSAKEEASTYINVKKLLTGVYHGLPEGLDEIGGAMWASASDDAVETNKSSVVYNFTNGSWGPLNTSANLWSKLYKNVFNANVFIHNLDTTVVDQLKYNPNYDGKKQQIKYFLPQARFLRAFFYFELLRAYGSVPLIKKPLTAEEANSVKLSSVQDVVNFIVSECNKIIPKLPESYDNIFKQEFGRVTKGAAMALKAKTLLYAASPLFDPSGDKSKWVDAAKAAHKIIALGIYSLDPNYSDIVNKLPNSELIFGRRLSASNSFEKANFPVGYKGRSGNCPTQNLVSAYEMTNGKDINGLGSGYDPNHPYRNRDPRLKKTIIVNNSLWKGRRVQIWQGGKDGLPKTLASPTGYYLKKYVIENLNISPPNPTSREHVWVYFRYGGILLDYAEAMNEAYGPYNPADLGMTARQVVDKIRERVNMPDFPTGLTKSEFRKKIHRERRVEMAFENQRFWDLRRWKIGSSTNVIKGMKINKNSDSTFRYQIKTIQNHVWDKKMNFFPIPKNELFVNNNLKQNQGW